MQLSAEDLDGAVKRLQRAQGQLGGIIRMIQEGRDCQDIVTQIAAVSKAIDRAGFVVIASGLKECVIDGDGDTAQMERLFLSLA
ncbi:MAG: metal-sensitive transcriptional regulator [Acidobacteriota bacterium]|nr:metal-sensitive transcriptional regulator [Acidobacteriota bacterium]NLH69530.1 metal-sensitive transcriptional regulator [Brooklawnia sp.]